MQQLTFNRNIEVINTLPEGVIAFAFNPKFVEITFLAENKLDDNTDVAIFLIRLREEIEGGYTEMVKQIQLPASILSAIGDIDFSTMNPVINLEEFNKAFSALNFRLT